MRVACSGGARSVLDGERKRCQCQLSAGYSLGALLSPLRGRICADMPPRRSARSLSAAEAATLGLASLPLPLAHRIILALPLDARGRASCVCRAWRIMPRLAYNIRNILAEPTLWMRLNLTDAETAFSGLLQGAARRAQGQLVALDMGTGRFVEPAYEVLAVLAANSGSLRELRVGWLEADLDGRRQLDELLLELPAVMRAAPHLQLLDVHSMESTGEVALRVLRTGAPLRVHRLSTRFYHPYTLAARTDYVAAFAAALADATLLPELSEVGIVGAETQQPAVMDALVDAVIARPRLHKLRIGDRCTPPAPASLARLLRNDTLPSLSFDCVQHTEAPLFTAAGAMVVADALRSNTTLMELSFHSSGLLRNVAASVTLLGALVGHLSLSALEFEIDDLSDPVALVAALAALVAADAPALRTLRLVHIYGLRDSTFAPLVSALAGNRHLRELDITGSHLSAAFVRDQLLPAARRANEQRVFTVTGSTWFAAQLALAANRRGD